MTSKHNSDTPPTIGVCHGSRCGDYGGRELLAELHSRGLAAEAMDCRSLCTYFPVVRLHGGMLTKATLAELLERLDAPETHA